MFFPKRETTQKTNKNWQERPAIRECHVTCSINFDFARSTSLLLIFFRDEIHQGYTVLSLSSGHFLPSPDGPFSGLATARKCQYPLCILDRTSLSGVRDWPKFLHCQKVSLDWLNYLSPFHILSLELHLNSSYHGLPYCGCLFLFFFTYSSFN